MPKKADRVIELDRKRMRAMEARDYVFLEATLADDLVYIHSSSSVQTKRRLISNLKSGCAVYAALEPTYVVAQDLGDMIVLTGTARAEGTADGAPLSYKVRFIDTYEWRDNRWQMVGWQSTRMA